MHSNMQKIVLFGAFIKDVRGRVDGREREPKLRKKLRKRGQSERRASFSLNYSIRRLEPPVNK